MAAANKKKTKARHDHDHNAAEGDASELLYLALHCGMARFLRLEELLAAFNTCALLRRDGALVRQSAVDTKDVEWFPTVLTDISALASTSRRLHELWEKGSGDDDRLAVDAALLETMTCPELRLHVLALAVFLQKRVMRWCFVYESLNPDARDEMLCSVRPALIPINGYDLQRFGGSADMDAPMLLHVKNQLNAMKSGFGDSFVGLRSETESRFGCHWEHINGDKRSDQIECQLCAAAMHSVVFFRRQAVLFIHRYTKKLVLQQQKWKDEDGKTEQEVAALTEALRLKHFPHDAYIAFNVMHWSDAEVFQHICRHRKFLINHRVVEPDDTLMASLSSKYRHQCRRFYQPMKELLTRRFKFIGRAQLLVAPVGNDRRSSVSSNHPRNVEFVGGLDTSTGFLCGVYCSFH